MPKRVKVYRPDGTFAHYTSVYTKKEIDALLSPPEPEPEPEPEPTVKDISGHDVAITEPGVYTGEFGRLRILSDDVTVIDPVINGVPNLVAALVVNRWHVGDTGAGRVIRNVQIIRPRIYGAPQSALRIYDAEDVYVEDLYVAGTGSLGEWGSAVYMGQGGDPNAVCRGVEINGFDISYVAHGSAFNVKSHCRDILIQDGVAFRIGTHYGGAFNLLTDGRVDYQGEDPNIRIHNVVVDTVFPQPPTNKPNYGGYGFYIGEPRGITITAAAAYNTAKGEYHAPDDGASGPGYNLSGPPSTYNGQVVSTPSQPPVRGAWAQGNGVNLVAYDAPDSAGAYWTGGTNARSITADQAQRMADIGVKHVRLGFHSIFHSFEDDAVLASNLNNLADAGLEVSYSTWSGATGFDPSADMIDRSVVVARWFATRYPDVIHNVWNEPGGKHQQSFYGHHHGLNTHRTNAAGLYPWVQWNSAHVIAALEVNPDARFIFDDTHWGQGAQGSSLISRSALSLIPELVTRTGVPLSQVAGSIHYYETWEDRQVELSTLLDQLSVEQVRFGEFGGDPEYAKRGKTTNHHSYRAYEAGVQCVAFSHPKVLGRDIWHGGQSYYSGFCISDLKYGGRRYPWLIDYDTEPLTDMGGRWYDSLDG